MILYGVDNAYELTPAAVEAIYPGITWVNVYIGGPTATHAWNIAAKHSLEAAKYRTTPCYVGQNFNATYTRTQAEKDASDAETLLKRYGYQDGRYWLDTEYQSYFNQGSPVLTYIDRFHQCLYEAGYHPGQYGSGPMLRDYHPSVPCAAWLAQWFGSKPLNPPNILDIPMSAQTKARYNALAWQYFNAGAYDLSVSDERIFDSMPAAVPVDLPGILRPLSDGTEERFFAETGFAIAHGFRSYWERYGVPESGLLLFGYPISHEYTRMMDNGQGITVQYFERARFEWHPHSDPARYDVMLGLIGNTLCAVQNERVTYPHAFEQGDTHATG